MNVLYNPDEMKRIGEARESFSGRLLSERQFGDAMAITGIIERRIKETGAFKDCLNDFANAYARTERFDIMKADSTLRDLFKTRTGVTMNQMREALTENEQKLFDSEKGLVKGLAKAKKQKVTRAVNEVGKMVEEGNKMTFHRAYAHQAGELAIELNVTDTGAKKLMAETFKDTEGRELREWGKELDEKYFRPQIDAEQKQRREAKSYSRSRQPSQA